VDALPTRGICILGEERMDIAAADVMPEGMGVGHEFDHGNPTQLCLENS